MWQVHILCFAENLWMQGDCQSPSIFIFCKCHVHGDSMPIGTSYEGSHVAPLIDATRLFCASFTKTVTDWCHLIFEDNNTIMFNKRLLWNNIFRITSWNERLYKLVSSLIFLPIWPNLKIDFLRNWPVK